MGEANLRSRLSVAADTGAFVPHPVGARQDAQLVARGAAAMGEANLRSRLSAAADT